MKMLRELRKAKGLSMKEFGSIFGIAESTVSQYETGKRQPDFETLLRFGEFFDVSVDYLLRGESAQKIILILQNVMSATLPRILLLSKKPWKTAKA